MGAEDRRRHLGVAIGTRLDNDVSITHLAHHSDFVSSIEPKRTFGDRQVGIILAI